MREDRIGDPTAIKTAQKTVNVAVIGTGRWGQNLVRKVAELPGASLVTVCDLDEAKLDIISRRYVETRTTTDLNLVMGDEAIDTVIVGSPAPLHYAHAKAALEAGKHVFVEKPITLDVMEAKELIDLAEASNLVLMVGHLLIYHPAVAAVKTLVDSGEIGHVYYLYSQRLNLGAVRKDENALWSLAPHDVAVAIHLIDKKPVSVAAQGQCYLRSGIEDVVFVTLTFEDGIIAHAHVSWLDPHKTRKFTIVGSEKMVVFDDMEGSEKVRIYDRGAELSSEYKGYGEDLTLRFGNIVIPTVKMQEPLAVELMHFLDCARTRRQPLTDGHSGLEVLKVLRAAQASLDRQGELVEVAEFAGV